MLAVSGDVVEAICATTTYEPDAFINRFGPVLFMIYRDQIARRSRSAAKTKPQKQTK